MNSKLKDLGFIPLLILIISNVIHLPLTISIIFEQINTGFGYGTDYELGVLYYWIIEFILILPIILSLIFILIMFKEKNLKKEILNRLILLLILILQIALSNLFIFY